MSLHSFGAALDFFDTKLEAPSEVRDGFGRTPTLNKRGGNLPQQVRMVDEFTFTR